MESNTETRLIDYTAKLIGEITPRGEIVGCPKCGKPGVPGQTLNTELTLIIHETRLRGMLWTVSKSCRTARPKKE